MELAENKDALRQRMMNARVTITPHDRASASASASYRLVGLPVIEQASTVLAYSATEFEADPWPAVRSLLARGDRVLLPRVAGDQLEAVEVTDLSNLQAGYAGVMEPVGEPVSIEEIDVVVVPGVAFDRAGHRLGRGGGHYDRLLARMDDQVTAVGFAFARQVVSAVPVNEDDQPVHLLVTDEYVVQCTRHG